MVVCVEKYDTEYLGARYIITAHRTQKYPSEELQVPEQVVCEHGISTELWYTVTSVRVCVSYNCLKNSNQISATPSGCSLNNLQMSLLKPKETLISSWKQNVVSGIKLTVKV